MGQLELYFIGKQLPALDRVRFKHPITDIASELVRGKTTGAYFHSLSAPRSTFQWTPAVQALCILVAETAISRFVDGTPAILSGENNSPASSLDFAISKGPLWLHDLFGAREDGIPNFKFAFARTNTERRRAGPVAISIRKSFLDPTAIDIYWDGEQLDTRETIVALASLLNTNWKPSHKYISNVATKNVAIRQHSPSQYRLAQYSSTQYSSTQLPSTEFSKTALPAPFDRPYWLQRLRRSVNQELLSRLRATDVFTRNGYRKLVQRYSTDPFFSKHSKKAVQLVSDIDLQLTSSDRLGLPGTRSSRRKALTDQRPLRIATNTCLNAASAIFTYLKQNEQLAIDLDYFSATSTEVVEKILGGTFSEEPDACVLSVSAAAPLFCGQTDYVPLMLLPEFSHTIVSRKSAGKNVSLNCGDYIFMAGTVDITCPYFDNLVRTGLISRNKVSVSFAEPDEAASMLRGSDGDIRALLWFPFGHFNTWFNGCQMLPNPIVDDSASGRVLFVHRSLYADSNKALLLDSAVRDAWLTLKEGGPVFENIIDDLISDGETLKLLKRCSGVHSFRSAAPD